MRDLVRDLTGDETQLSDADRAQLLAIQNEPDEGRCAALIRAYWHDLDRAERTPRSYLYFHLGLLTGIVAKLQRERPPAVH
jgi:hypothetical protein